MTAAAAAACLSREIAHGAVRRAHPAERRRWPAQLLLSGRQPLGGSLVRLHDEHNTASPRALASDHRTARHLRGASSGDFPQLPPIARHPPANTVVCLHVIPGAPRLTRRAPHQRSAPASADWLSLTSRLFHLIISSRLPVCETPAHAHPLLPPAYPRPAQPAARSGTRAWPMCGAAGTREHGAILARW